MTTIMGPVVAGSFYPADADVLRANIRRLLTTARTQTPTEAATGAAVRGLIVPHAGYIYSGPVAASGYALLNEGTFERVVLIGPSHFDWFPGIAVPGTDALGSPLGPVRVIAPTGFAPGRLRRYPSAFASEHCLEVQLPFLQETLGDFSVTPLLTGDIGGADAADVLDAVVDEETLLIVSSDLSHYHDYDTTVELDRSTADAILARDPVDIGRQAACGRTGIQAALHLAKRRGWEVELLDLRNSGDTAGPRDRVVGYGAFVFT
jgi:hypothetical protein